LVEGLQMSETSKSRLSLVNGGRPRTMSTDRSPQPFIHRPVMVDEVVALLDPVPAGTFVDATLGGGGHARRILESRDDLALLGLDRDLAAIEAATVELADFGDRVTIRQARFDRLADEVEAAGAGPLSAVLFDLGVSSPQLDRADRGFSYRKDGPLDMRMDRRQELTAAEVVNDYEERRLERVLQVHGDERHARRIARAIVGARPIQGTLALAEVIKTAIPAAARRTGGHPAKRSFQAIRIEVNNELEQLGGALDQAIDGLAERGRCAVLTYHSGEDRIVKATMRRAAGEDDQVPAGLPVEPEPTGAVRWVRRRPWRPTDAERAENPRAESARLRAVEKVASTNSARPGTKVLEG
jgi:16S rRNA (cytosine1402-N4)-methyltransferase